MPRSTNSTDMAFIPPVHAAFQHIVRLGSVSRRPVAFRVRRAPTCALEVGDTTRDKGGKSREEKNEEGEEGEEEVRLQNDKPLIMREFGKVAALAICIGVLLFCFDILVFLLALTIALIYTLAVVLDIRIITRSVRRLVDVIQRVRASLANLLRRSM